MIVRHLKKSLQLTFSKSRALNETLKVQERRSLQAVLPYPMTLDKLFLTWRKEEISARMLLKQPVSLIL